MSKWESIEAFVAVAHHQSFSKAAVELGVSKSHISKQISQLESRLNVQLLVRTTRKVSMTEAGKAFSLRCRDVLNNLDEAEQAIVDQQENPRGLLRMTVAGAFGEEFIAPASAEFMRQYNGIAIELDFTNRVVDLIAEGYDLAIRSGTLKDSSLIARRVCNRKLITCATPEYLERHGVPDNIRTLSSHNCLVGTLGTWRFRDQDRNFDIRVEGNWRSNNGRALTHAALAGIGIIQAPDFYVREAINAGKLLPILEKFKPTDTGVWAVYPKNRHLSIKVRLFVNHLVETLPARVSG